MIKSISTIYKGNKKECDFLKTHEYKYQIDSSQACEDFTLKITFECPIIAFRNHDYTWVKVDAKLIATEFSPKIIKLANHKFVQANQNKGIWEVNSKYPSVLLWHFNIQMSKPIVNYVGKNNYKKVSQANNIEDNKTPLALLLSDTNAIEVSRSKIPFSAIACFTDHCDFDSLENVRIQRQFFNKHNIKITKGFFLNHFSKRDFNVSVERDCGEFEAWLNDGHELAYHSLSQSLKNDKESLNDFKTFIPPFQDVVTWIDHGFQPYNFSLYEAKGISNSSYELTLLDKKLSILWNYLDTGTATKGVINQLNPKHFTLSAYYKGTKHYALKDRLKLNIKNLLMHFFNSKKHQELYTTLASDYKNVYSKPFIKRNVSLFKNGILLGVQMLSVFMFSKTKRRQIYPIAKYTPIIFKHRLNKHDFYIFQTLEMVDFKAALCKTNIDILIKESGVFIAHTYFSVPLSYHKGKLFKTPTAIDEDVAANFTYLSKQIEERRIWNPRLKELVSHFNRLENITFDCSDKGVISIQNAEHIIFRPII